MMRVVAFRSEQLQVLPRWQVFGTPALVGAVAYEPVVAPDIDLEMLCGKTHIKHGFDVLGACALHPNIQVHLWLSSLIPYDLMTQCVSLRREV
jgi:hypothetical protein